MTALFNAGNEHWLEVGAGCVNGGRIAGRAGAENQDAGVFLERRGYGSGLKMWQVVN